MPTSSCETISAMVRFIQKANPNSILDVGSGFGKYGMLAREYLEIGKGRDHPEQWSVEIDAVEIWEPYRKFPAYGAYYNNFYNDDIANFVKHMKTTYDLAICGDVLEHLEKSKAQRVLKKLLKHCSHVLVSIPLGKWPVSVVGENIYENHISTWEDSDLKHLPIIKIDFYDEPRIAVALLKGELQVCHS